MLFLTGWSDPLTQKITCFNVQNPAFDISRKYHYDTQTIQKSFGGSKARLESLAGEDGSQCGRVTGKKEFFENIAKGEHLRNGGHGAAPHCSKGMANASPLRSTFYLPKAVLPVSGMVPKPTGCPSTIAHSWYCLPSGASAPSMERKTSYDPVSQRSNAFNGSANLSSSRGCIGRNK